MHRSLPAVLALSLVAAAPAAQQGPPGPADQLDEFAAFEGSWEGSGTVTMAPDSPAMPWTSRSTFTWVLGGHFLREVTVIEAETMPVPLVFITHYGWDRENGRYVQISLGNEGKASMAHPVWLDDSTMVSTDRSVDRGLPRVEHSETKIAGDSLSFGMWVLHGRAPMVKAVEGTMKKVAGAEPVEPDLSATLAPVQQPMEKLARMAGEYEVTGSMVPHPGAEAVGITGSEHIRRAFGGAALIIGIDGGQEGAPDSYQAWGCTTWDTEAGCYRHYSIDNMGMIADSEGRWLEEGTLVHTSSGLRMGQPAVSRMLLRMGEDGSVESIVSHELLGGMDPAVVFEAEYTRK